MKYVDADLVQPAQPSRVATEAGDALLAAVVRPHAVVGEDAVEVEDDEPDLGERAVTLRARRRAASTALDVVVRRRLLDRERTHERPAERAPSSSYGGRPPSAGDFATRSPGEDVAGREVARRDELLPHLLERPLLARERALHAVAERVRDAVEVADERRMPSGISENAWSVPFQAWLSVKCFSMTRAPSM